MVVSTAEAKNRLLDRMLMAQATVEGLVLVSGDAEIARHAPKGLRVICPTDVPGSAYCAVYV
jgi:hypothetical protein